MENAHLTRLCGQFRDRVKALLLQAGVARLALVAIALPALLMAIDWLVRTGWPWRSLFLILSAGAVAATAWYTLLRPLRRRWNDPEVLSYLDSVLPPEQAQLLDLYELTNRGGEIQELGSQQGRELAEAAVARLSAGVDKVDMPGALRRRVVNGWLYAGGAAAALLLLALLFPAGRQHVAIGLTRLLNPFSSTRWPHRTTITLADTPGAVPQFEPLTIAATVTGSEVPPDVMLFFRSQGGKGFDRVAVSVDRESGRASYKFDSVKDPLEFYLVGGDYETDRFRVAVIDRPYIKKVTARYTMPKYAGLPDKVDNSMQLSGLEGTKVECEFECSMRLKSARLTPVTGNSQPASTNRADAAETLTMSTPTTFRRSFVLSENVSYQIELEEEHGYRQARSERIDIRVTPYNPPLVELLSPGAETLQTSRALVDVSFRASDDFGLAGVQFLYQVDSSNAVVMSDRITGPVAQSGRKSEARFTWPLRKSELPEACVLTCFVRARNVNPNAERGVAESARAQIRLVKPTEFHLEVLEQSKALLAETRLAWLNALQSYAAGRQWQADGSGNEDDPLWLEMVEKQDRASEAARKLREHLQWLTEQYERNQMAREFMSGRLTPIGGLITRLLDKEQPPIVASLREARPQTAAQAVPAQLLARRKAAMQKINVNQKLSVLLLERILRRVYDWRDLQTSAVTTTLLIEQQEELIRLTEGLPPQWVGKQVEDLAEKEQDRLLTLGKRQQAVFDTESGLERQLDDLIYRARVMKRESVREPLWTAWQVLRNNRVNDYLKQAYTLIQDNQPSQVIKDQKAAITVLRVVESGLVVAGQKVDPEEPLTAAMDVAEEKQFDPELVVKPETPPDAEETAEVVEIKPSEMTDNPFAELPDPGTAIATAMRAAYELQDNVLGRLRYLAKNAGSEEMPRFIALKLMMLAERQQAACVRGLDRALAVANGTIAIEGGPSTNVPPASAPIREALTALRAQAGQFEKLIAGRDLSACHQQMQADSLAGLQDVLQLTAWEKAIEEETAENRRQQGEDSFGRQYLFRGRDLDTIAGLIAGVHHATLLQRDVIRGLSRFASAPAKEGAVAQFEQAARGRASQSQQRVAALVAASTKAAATMSTQVLERVRQTGVASLGELPLASFAAPIAAAKIGEAELTEMRAAERAMQSAMQSMREALGERVKPPAPPVELEPPAMTVDMMAKLMSREHLAELIGANSSLAPEIRDRLRRALEKDFPEKYKNLLSAYYGQFAEQEEERKTPTPAP